MWAIRSWYLSCFGERSTEAHCRIDVWTKSQDENFFVKPDNPRHGQEVVTGVALSCLSPAKGSLLSTHPILCRPSTSHPDFCNCNNSDKGTLDITAESLLTRVIKPLPTFSRPTDCCPSSLGTLLLLVFLSATASVAMSCVPILVLGEPF